MAPNREGYEAAALDHRAEGARILDGTSEATGARVLPSIANRHSSLSATAGYLAIAVPLGLRASGMPAGTTLIGLPGADAELLGIAYAGPTF